MARYRKIYPRIWTDEKFRTLSRAEKLDALYILTAQCNRIGIFRFSPAMAAEDLGTPPATFARRFANVCRTLGWKWDVENRVLYLPRWWKYNLPQNPNQFQACLADLHDLPATPLAEEFCANTAHLTEEMVKRLANVTPNVAANVTPNVSPQEPERDGEPDNKPRRSESEPDLAPSSSPSVPPASSRDREAQAIALYDTLRQGLGPKTKADLSTIENFLRWWKMQREIAAKDVSGLVDKARQGRPRKPIAVFLSLARDEWGYTPPSRGGGT